MPCKLKNVTKQSQVFNLAHESLRMAEGEYRYSSHLAGSTVPLADGQLQVRGRRKMLPSSITFLAGETKEDLPLVVLDCPEIKAALDPAVGKPRLLLTDRQEEPPAKETPVLAQGDDEKVKAAAAAQAAKERAAAEAASHEPTPAAQQGHKVPKRDTRTPGPDDATDTTPLPSRGRK